ncbi:MAG: A/G-specific adenine glycosylase [Clostridia bacterium]|nr:A/G-specific adenine glycosylase [Clostridia bacterium]
MKSQTDSNKFQKALLEWYQKNKREMPWRSKPTPYRIWLSEIMLQQTRVDTVIPYFEKFFKHIPTIIDLARTSDQDLLKLWEGLGYYRRVINMKKAAIHLVENNNGKLYDNKKDLLTLAGIGEYSAGAIASIAFQEKVCAVDGNVLRIMARLYGDYGNILQPTVSKRFTDMVEKLLPDSSIGDFNQALMELGALICTPKSPDCIHCPVMNFCIAEKSMLQNELPVRDKQGVRRKEDKTVLIIQFKNRFAITKRENRLLEGLWEFPVMDGHHDKDEVIETIEKWGMKVLSIAAVKKEKALFSHIEWDMAGFHIMVNNKCDGMTFEAADKIVDEYPIASAYQKYISELL